MIVPLITFKNQPHEYLKGYNLTNTNTNTPTTPATENITLRGKTGWGTLANTLRATIGAASTAAQTAGHAYTKTLEITLDAIPGEAGTLIAANARKKGLAGAKASILSNEATAAAIDSIYYAKEEFLGNTAYAEWAKALNTEDTADLKDALQKGLTTKALEEALEADPTGTTAKALITA